MTNTQSKAFVTEAESKLLIRNSLPMLGAILALFIYDLFESTLIAMQDASTLAAFGFTLPITATMTALAIGLSIRSNNKAVQCHCLTPHLLPQQVVHSLLTTLVTVATFSLLFFVFNDNILLLTGLANWLAVVDNAVAVEQQTQYMSWRYLGWVALALIWQANAILRALGWMKAASQLMFGWVAFKALLAFLLLAPSSAYQWMGFSGLGLAHLAADAVFAVISVSVLWTKVRFKMPCAQFRSHHSSVSKRDSLLVILQQFITPISMACLTAIAASIDASYVAALALLFRIEVLFLLLPMVLTTSMPAIVGANFWLGKQGRVRRLYRFAFVSIAAFQLLVALLASLQQDIISMFVCPHEAISLHIESYLNWVPWGYVSAGIAIVLQSCLNAKNFTLQAALLGMAHRLLFVLPLTALGGIVFGFEGFYQGMMLGHLGAIVAVVYVLKRQGVTQVQDTDQQTETSLQKVQR